MATLKIIAVRDRQLNAFMRPFAAQSLGQAIRSFRDEVNNPQSDLNKHPEDYELYHIADYDEATAAIVQSDPLPAQIAIASNLIEKGKT